MENKKIAEHPKIPGVKIEIEVDQDAMISKLRSDLYKKADKLVRECDVDVGIVLFVFPLSGDPSSFFLPTADPIIGRLVNPTIELSQTTQLIDSQSRDDINQGCDKLKELDVREKVAKSLILLLDQINETREKGWWESIDKFSADDVTKFDAWLDSASFRMNYLLELLENEATSSSPSQ